MNIIVNILGKFVGIFDLKNCECVSIIDDDKGLILYLLNILKRYILTNKDGYLQFENKKGETYLHRIILEYYSQYNEKLKKYLCTKGFEVNHKNKDKYDNRLENLELLTKKGNLLHEHNTKYEDEIIISTEELLNIKNKLMKNKKYNSNKKYLEKVSHNNIKCIEENNYNTKFYRNLYVRFSNKTICTYTTFEIVPRNIVVNTTLTTFTTLFQNITKNTFFNTYKIKKILVDYDIYRYKIIQENNLKLVLKYYNSNSSFKYICNKYKLLDDIYIKEDVKKSSSHNILIELLYYLRPETIPHKFYKNEPFVTVPINALLLAMGKYTSMRVLFLLGMLKRRQVPFKTDTHTATSFIIPEYTDDFFISTIIPNSIKLQEMNLSKITYTIITDNFGEEISDSIYLNNKLKKKYKRDSITINTIKEILLTSTTLKSILLQQGFIDVMDVIHETGLEEKDKKFVSGVLKNDKILKETLDSLDLVFTRLNKPTINNIRTYQIQHHTRLSYLYYTQTKIILKNLYIKTN